MVREMFSQVLYCPVCLNKFSNLERSAEIAVRFTAESILRTFKAQTDYRFGVNFEQSIPDLLKELKLI